jgi:regulation of enolase protein 1 (concanavalin A-like superfamily)
MIKKNIIHSIVILLLVITGPGLFAQANQKSASNSLKNNPVPLASFKHGDVGNPSIKGIVKISNNGFDITAGGADIWGVKDEFNFVYVERTGDFDLVSRIESLTAANLYTKAGLMARENLTAGCRHIYFQVFSDNNPRNKNNGGYEFQYRQEKDSLMKAIYPKSSEGTPEFPVEYPNTWIRLQRVKNEFTGYYSTDGKTWKVYTTYTLELPPKIYLGLAVTSHNPNHTASAKFRNIAELKK